jgi:hypothetical protein
MTPHPILSRSSESTCRHSQSRSDSLYTMCLRTGNRSYSKVSQNWAAYPCAWWPSLAQKGSLLRPSSSGYSCSAWQSLGRATGGPSPAISWSRERPPKSRPTLKSTSFGSTPLARTSAGTASTTSRVSTARGGTALLNVGLVGTPRSRQTCTRGRIYTATT